MMLMVFFFFLAALHGAAAIPGGLVDADMSPEATKALEYAEALHNRGSTDNYLHLVSEVVSVKTQVVAGMKYYFQVILVNTLCPKNSHSDGCEIPTDPKIAQPRECRIVVWTKPWLNQITLQEFTC